jgi:ribosome recycling factor
MSEERRQQTVKLLKEKLEQHKVAIRNARKESMKQIDGNKGEPGVSEDNIEAAKKEIQDLTKKHEKNLEEAFEVKSKEVLTV